MYWMSSFRAMVIQSRNVLVRLANGIERRRSGNVADVVVADGGMVRPQQ